MLYFFQLFSHLDIVLGTFLVFFLFFFVQVQDLIKNLVDEHFKFDMEAVMKDPILFGDYSNALDETEPRVYKDIIDYEASKALFQV